MTEPSNGDELITLSRNDLQSFLVNHYGSNQQTVEVFHELCLLSRTSGTDSQDAKPATNMTESAIITQEMATTVFSSFHRLRGMISAELDFLQNILMIYNGLSLSNSKINRDGDNGPNADANLNSTVPKTVQDLVTDGDNRWIEHNGYRWIQDPSCHCDPNSTIISSDRDFPVCQECFRGWQITLPKREKSLEYVRGNEFFTKTLQDHIPGIPDKLIEDIFNALFPSQRTF